MLQICERHFKPEDIITETSRFDAEGNVTKSVPLQNHRLAPDAVPCIFEDLPAVKLRKKVKISSSLKENQDKTTVESSVRTSKPTITEISQFFQTFKCNISGIKLHLHFLFLIAFPSQCFYV